jgi:hypothetical protein
MIRIAISQAAFEAIAATPRARFSTCWSNPSATSTPR